MSRCRPILVLLLATAAAPLPAQEPPPRPNGTVKVFLDCQTRGCDFDHFRRAIPVVSWVRDRTDADVHILVTRQGTGGGGSAYTITFIGLRDHAGSEYTVRHLTHPDDTALEDRDAFTRALQLGLGPYLANSPAAARVQVFFTPTSNVVLEMPEDDPWDFWVFRISTRGSLNGESDQRFMSGNGSISASRVTEELKIGVSARANGNRSEYDVVLDTITGRDTTYVSSRTSYGADGEVVWSLGPHWSTGAHGEVNRNSALNLDLAVQAGPAVEYNIFPYEESTRRSLTFTYSVGVAAYDYTEETIFLRMSEIRPAHRIEVSLNRQEPWGGLHAGANAFQYLHDLKKHSAGVGLGFNFRVARGLDFNMGLEAARIKDQLYLSREGLTPEEVLLQQRARGTEFRYGLNTGLSYRFGSKFNNVVNPRFD